MRGEAIEACFGKKGAEVERQTTLGECGALEDLDFDQSVRLSW